MRGKVSRIGIGPTLEEVRGRPNSGGQIEWQNSDLERQDEGPVPLWDFRREPGDMMLMLT
jgi:hypothetical protein